MNWLLKAILITVICGFLAFGGVRIIEPGKEKVTIIWTIFFSICMLGYEGLIVYRLNEEKKVREIRDGKRPIG